MPLLPGKIRVVSCNSDSGAISQLSAMSGTDQEIQNDSAMEIDSGGARARTPSLTPTPSPETLRMMRTKTLPDPTDDVAIGRERQKRMEQVMG